VEQVPHQQAHEVARTRAGKSGIDPGGGAEPPGGHGVGGLARQWPRGLTPAAAACEGGGRGKALAAALRARAAQCERWRAPRRLHAREVEARGSSGHREGAARRGRAARVGAVR